LLCPRSVQRAGSRRRKSDSLSVWFKAEKPFRVKNFCLLVVEDDLVTSLTLCKALRLGIPDALVLTAHSLAEARLTLQEYRVNLFILDVNLPDGSGIDFIFDVTIHNPDARIALMTATPLPEYRDQAAAFGVMHFLAKPVNYETLLALVRESRTAPETAPGEDASLFSVALSRLTVLDIIQLKCLNDTTQGINFRSPTHGSGWVFFENGEIIHAETARAKGMTALSEIIGWKSGHAEEASTGPAVERTISGGWQSVLLIAAQAADERQER
jgi:ActR/RegA family two-component response regulator